MTMKKKKYNARFPPARIKKIMQTDEEVGKVAQPVPVIISRALELFVENLLKKANDITSQRGARTLTPSHLKMCIKSESRFDFLKELVSSVPELQGDHDEPPPQTQGLDLTMSTLNNTADQMKNTSVASRPLKFPRQLSTPKPRGRPRTVSLDSEGKIPKKRKKKRQMKFVDDLEANSDFSNDELEADNNQQPSTTKVIDDDVVQDKIVTCTVTTGLTTQNGFNNGSLLGFTLSIPSTSLSSTPVSTLSSPNGSSETSTDLVTNVTKEKNNDNFKALNNPPHDPSKTSTVQDVDEDYDNF